MNRLKTFNKYRTIDSEWLGHIPDHWQVRSLGSITRPISIKGRSDLPLLSVVREKGVIPRSTMSDDENHNFVPDDLKNYKVVKTGDLVINKMKAWQGSLGIAPMEGVVSPAYYVYELKIDNLKFGQILLRSKPYVHFFAQVSEGVRIGQWDLSVAGMKRIPVLLPPPEEQEAIVHFLDYVDRKVRRYVSEKRKQIALLSEQKQAIVHRFVTRGVQQDQKLSSSHVDWLGDIPAHWKTMKVKHLALFNPSKKEISSLNKNAEVTFLPMERVGTWGELDTSEKTKIGMVDSGFTYMRNGDVIVAKITPCYENGKAAVCKNLPYEFAFGSTEFHVLRPSKDLLADYLYYLMHDPVVLSSGAIEMRGSAGQQRVPAEFIKNLRIPVPPVSEQIAIVESLEQALDRFTRMTSCFKDEIRSLQEYQTKLISDVVTGKLDIREAEKSLPQVLDEAAPDIETVNSEDLEEERNEIEAEPEEVMT